MMSMNSLDVDSSVQVSSNLIYLKLQLMTSITIFCFLCLFDLIECAKRCEIYSS